MRAFPGAAPDGASAGVHTGIDGEGVGPTGYEGATTARPEGAR